MTSCRPADEMIEERIDRVLTQYRESPKLLHVIRTYLSQVTEISAALCVVPDYFDLDTAVGDQLTIIGKRLGWPRCHCVCDIEPVFGFACADDQFSLRPILGFCEGADWAACVSSGVSEVCINDDELYRRFLKVRRYQFLNLYDLTSLEESLRIFFGPAAGVMYAGQGRVVVTPGRDLTPAEVGMLQLYARVLPIALGMRVTFHFGPRRVFGFGEGWGGLAEDDLDATADSIAFQRTGKVFGFCETPDNDVGGFCADWAPDGLPLTTGDIDEDGEPVLIVDELGNPISTGPLTADSAWLCKTDAPWMCEINVHPYDC